MSRLATLIHPPVVLQLYTACSVRITVDMDKRASSVRRNPVFSRWFVLRDVTARAGWIIYASQL